MNNIKILASLYISQYVIDNTLSWYVFLEKKQNDNFVMLRNLPHSISDFSLLKYFTVSKNRSLFSIPCRNYSVCRDHQYLLN